MVIIDTREFNTSSKISFSWASGLSLGFKHSTGSVSVGGLSIKSSARHELDLFNGFKRTTTETFSTGNIEYVGFDQTGLPSSINPKDIAETVSTAKFAAVKYDKQFAIPVGPIAVPAVGGVTADTLNGEFGIRGGLGTTDTNVYAELSVDIDVAFEGAFTAATQTTEFSGAQSLGTRSKTTSIAVNSTEFGQFSQEITTVSLAGNGKTGTSIDRTHGNVYAAGNVGIGQELNGLDQFAHEQGVIQQTKARIKDSILSRKKLPAYTPEQKAQLDALPDNFCFLEGTKIDMWPLDLKPDENCIYDEKEVLAKVWQKPIEEVTPEDWVLSYDDDDRLKPGRVTRTFQNRSKHILDVHGLMMTPGHVTYCAPVEGEENKFAGKHVPVIDILRSDGALMKADGTLIRASTGCEVGSEDDEQFWAFRLYEDQDGSERVGAKCQLRFGTRWMLPNGNHFSMREFLDGISVEIIKEGPQRGYARFQKTGFVSVFAWTLSESLPKPEDYVLQRSQVTLDEIYEADDWEAVRPQTPPPFTGEAGRSYKRDNTLHAKSLSDHLPPNIPHSMRNSPNQPTMSRKQRRAMEAKQRKAGKRSAVTVH